MKKSYLMFFILILFGMGKPLAAQPNEMAYFKPKVCRLKKIQFTISDSWVGRDKAHHFLTSAFLTTAGYYYGREVNKWSNAWAQNVGVSFSLSLGLLKEVRDGLKPNNAFSWKDLVADLCGTFVGLALVSD